MGGPLTTVRPSMVPVLEMVACKITVPWILAALAIAGYWGWVFTRILPAITPEETAIFLGAAALTTGAGPVPIPPRMPPITPPAAPASPPIPATPEEGGGAADSVICLI